MNVCAVRAIDDPFTAYIQFYFHIHTNLPVLLLLLSLVLQVSGHLRGGVQADPGELNPDPAQVQVQVAVEL